MLTPSLDDRAYRPLPSRLVNLEGGKLCGDGFGGVHSDGAGIPITCASPAPAGELVSADRNGSERDFRHAGEIRTACRAADNPAHIAVQGSKRDVGIDDG